MKNRTFTFGICTYNSKDYIIDTLESIKYQITSYGNGIVSNLVISDDASTDETICFCKEWIENNKNLFNEILIIENPINKGLAKNYSKLLRNIKTEYFIKIDGDDLICSKNIFEKCMAISENEMRIYFPLKFNLEKVYADEIDICNYLKYSLKLTSHKKDLHLFETLKPFNTPEVVLGRKCFTDECLEFVEKYTQFEDDTSLYHVIKNNVQMKMKFIIDPLVLYRVHNKSLSNGGVSAHQIEFLDDLHKFKKQMLKNEDNIFVKLYLLLCVWDTFLMKHRFRADNCLHRKIRKYWINKNISEARSTLDYDYTLKRINKICNDEQVYVELIMKNSQKYYSGATS